MGSGLEGFVRKVWVSTYFTKNSSLLVVGLFLRSTLDFNPVPLPINLTQFMFLRFLISKDFFKFVTS